jgi:hypothetical protein
MADVSRNVKIVTTRTKSTARTLEKVRQTKIQAGPEMPHGRRASFWS